MTQYAIGGILVAPPLNRTDNLFNKMTITRGRSAISGRFVPVAQARRNPTTNIVQRIKQPSKHKKSR